MVLADGSFVTASETENADLLWALRGGGGNFGVVTSFLFRTHPVSMVYGGPIVFELADAPAVMKWYREFQPSAPDEFYIFLGLQSVPPADPFPKEHWSKKMCVLLVSHNGPLAGGREGRQRGPRGPAEADHRLGPADALHGDPDAVRPRCYPKGLQWYWKGDFVKELPDAAIDAHLAHAAKLPSVLSAMHLYPIDGAVHRQKKDATAWGYRDAAWSMVIFGVDPDPAKAPGAQAMGAGLLGGGPSVQSARRLCELHDGRRGRGAGQGRLRR